MPFDGDIFDIMGPVMIGPSSSHTAGAVRLGRMALLLFGEKPKSVRFYLHGSFYMTMAGHGTDLALVAGLLGLRQDDPRIRSAFTLAEKAGLQYCFEPFDADGAHPNTVRMELAGENGKTLAVQGSSVGGGNILVTMIDDFSVEFSGAYPALIVFNRDKPGIVAETTRLVAAHSVNIAFMRVTRLENDRACTIIECDGAIKPEIVQAIASLNGVVTARLVERLD